MNLLLSNILIVFCSCFTLYPVNVSSIGCDKLSLVEISQNEFLPNPLQQSQGAIEFEFRGKSFAFLHASQLFPLIIQVPVPLQCSHLISS